MIKLIGCILLKYKNIIVVIILNLVVIFKFVLCFIILFIGLICDINFIIVLFDIGILFRLICLLNVLINGDVNVFIL